MSKQFATITGRSKSRYSKMTYHWSWMQHWIKKVLSLFFKYTICLFAVQMARVHLSSNCASPPESDIRWLDCMPYLAFSRGFCCMCCGFYLTQNSLEVRLWSGRVMLSSAIAVKVSLSMNCLRRIRFMFCAAVRLIRFWFRINFCDLEQLLARPLQTV